MRAERLAWFGLLCALVLAPAAGARAFCRTTTCDPTMEPCAMDEHGCVLDGTPLFWPDACVTVWVAPEPALPGVDGETLQSLAQAAFDSWRAADCGESGPAFDALVAGSLDCAEPREPGEVPVDVNTIHSVIGEWSHPGAFGEIALTTVGFNPHTGEIRGFDIELNAADQTFTTSETGVSADLLSTLTHEVGHALGLAHSDVWSATMFPQTGRTTQLRSLEGDDEAAICEAYPPAPGVDVCGDAVSADPEAVCAEIDARASALTRTRSGCSVHAPGERAEYGWLGVIAVLAWAGATVPRFRRSRARSS